MRGIYADHALTAAMADAEHIRAFTNTIPEAVRQMQREVELRQEMYRQVHEIYESVAFRQLMLELEQRRELLREMSLNAAAGVQAMMESMDSVSNMLYRNRALIDPLVLASFSGGGSSPPVSGSLRKANQKLAKSYQKVSESGSTEEEMVVPTPIKALSTTEAFTSAEIVEELDLRSGLEPDEEEIEERKERRKILRDLKEEARVQLVPSLAEVDPVFAKIWQGAILALASDNPERVRHFSASCRALLEYLLERFAPKQKLKRWSPTEVKFVNGKPERRTQLSYICRAFPETSGLVEFTENDIDEVLATFNVYNRGIHGLDPSFTADEVDALETRTAQNLIFLLSFRSKVN